MGEVDAAAGVAPRPLGRGARLAVSIALGLLGLGGLLVRIWSMGRESVNGDEAIVGLMAHEILHGHFFAFYWGQNYGGAEPYVVAALFGVAGQSSFTLTLAPVLLDVVATLLVWRIGRRLLGPAAGIAAAAVFWIFPEVLVHLSVIEYGFRWVTLDCGLGLLLLAMRRGEPVPVGRARTLCEWAALGLLAGIGWWSSPEIVYYALPALGLLVVRLARRALRPDPAELGVGLGAIVVGALPWLWSNVRDHFASLRAGAQPPQPGGPFWYHLRLFGGKVLPMYLGLRLRASGHWFPDRPVALGLYALVLVGLAALCVRLLLRREALLLVACVVAFPLIYAYSPFTWYWQDGRYGLYLGPVIALVGAAAALHAAQLVRRLRPRLAPSPLAVGALALVVAACAATSSGAMTRLAPYEPGSVSSLIGTGAGAYETDPTGVFAKLATALERAGIHDVEANYWVAEPLAFESRGALVADDPDFTRYRPYAAADAAAVPPATWLFVPADRRTLIAHYTTSPFVDPGCLGRVERCITAPAFRAYLHGIGVGYTVRELGDFVAVSPDAHISALAVLRAFGHEPEKDAP